MRDHDVTNKLPFLLGLGLAAATATADDSTLDAAIGGGLGGAAGAAIGNEVGGRDGAIAGAAIGAAVGTALNTDPPKRRHTANHGHYTPRHGRAPARGGHPHPHFCPPGQAKKGRC